MAVDFTGGGEKDIQNSGYGSTQPGAPSGQGEKPMETPVDKFITGNSGNPQAQPYGHKVDKSGNGVDFVEDWNIGQ